LSRVEGTLSPAAPAGKSSCANLKALFGKRYRVRHEESYYAERAEFRAQEEVWLQIIACAGTPRNCPPKDLTRYTHIYPFGSDTLAVYKAGRQTVVVKRLLAVGCQVETVGDDGTTLLFPVALFPEVAKIVHPLRRRVASEAERGRLRRLSEVHSPFRKIPFTETPEAGLVCVRRGRDGSEHLQLGNGAFALPSVEVR